MHSIYLLHLKMQISHTNTIDLLKWHIIVHLNKYHYQTTGSTFIFDRGKFHRTELPCCRLQQFCYITLMSKPTSAQILFPKMDRAVAKHAPSQLKSLNKRNKKKKNNNPIFHYARKIYPSYENTIDKYVHEDPLENFISLAKRAEMIVESNCLLITGLPLSDPEFSPRDMKTWIQKMIPHFEKLLGIKVLHNDLIAYLNSAPDASIMHDGDSCALPIPIQQETFRFGGPNVNNNQYAMGINIGGHRNLFFMYQALPIQPEPIQSITSAVELCTFRGLPGNPFELQAILAMVHAKIRLYFAPLSNLNISDFDVVLHRRINLRHHLRTPSYEFVITVYCRPHEQLINDIRKKIQLEEEPAEVNLDWKGEKWTTYSVMSQYPPSAMLLHRTPYLCIYGFSEDTPTEDIIRAIHADNPSTPLLMAVVYCWRGPKDIAGSPSAIHFICNDHPPAFTLGAHLIALGAKSTVIDSYDNPSMPPVRRLTAGIIVHEQFVEATPLRDWTSKTRTAWLTHVDQIVKNLQTLKKGEKQSITHAGSTSWVPPSFVEQESKPMDSYSSTNEEATRLQESIRLQTIQLRRLQGTQTVNLDLHSDDSDSDYEEESNMSEDSGAMKVSPSDEVTSIRIQQQRILDTQAAMEARLEARIDARLMATLTEFFARGNPTHNSSQSSISEGQQTGGSYSKDNQNHE